MGVMAILCLAKDLMDLKERLGKIVIGYTNAAPSDRKPIYASDLKAHGAMATLLKDALRPNIVQTLENNVAMVHGGPFANIAHGCNTVMATKTALKLSEYVVTEAGFGADLGAEKFVDIKCRLSGLRPHAVVIVVSCKALKHHGGATPDQYKVEGLEALQKGLANLEKHLYNIREHYGLPPVVSINHFYHDTDAELSCLQGHLKTINVPAFVAKHWAHGGAGAEDLAKAVIAASEENAVSPMKFVYPSEDDLWTKIEKIATKIYGAAGITSSEAIKKKLDKWSKLYVGFPVCIAKTQMSFSTDPTKRGAPSGHTIEIREVRVANGAGFIVAIAGDMMSMPGLPKEPSSEKIDVLADGRIVGLF